MYIIYIMILLIVKVIFLWHWCHRFLLTMMMTMMMVAWRGLHELNVVYILSKATLNKMDKSVDVGVFG